MHWGGAGSLSGCFVCLHWWPRPGTFVQSVVKLILCKCHPQTPPVSGNVWMIAKCSIHPSIKKKKKKDCYSAPASTPRFISEFPIRQTGSSGRQGPSCGWDRTCSGARSSTRLGAGIQCEAHCYCWPHQEPHLCTGHSTTGTHLFPCIWEQTVLPEIEIHQFSGSVTSDSLQPLGLQHTRPPCPSPTPGASQTHVHQVGDAIQSFHPLLKCIYIHFTYIYYIYFIYVYIYIYIYIWKYIGSLYVPQM